MYEKLGAQAGIDRIVDDFYSIMSSDPEARECFLTHSGRDIQESATKLKAFLSGWLGGPPLYLEQYGHPRLRMRHFPFSIGEIEAHQWLVCMKKALDRSQVSIELQEKLLMAFLQVTKVIKNRGETN